MVDGCCIPELLKHRAAKASATHSHSGSDSNSGSDSDSDSGPLQQSPAGAHTDDSCQDRAAAQLCVPAGGRQRHGGHREATATFPNPSLCCCPPGHEGRGFVNEPELRLGRGEGIVPESPAGCTKWGCAGTRGSPRASAHVPAGTCCLFSLALSHPANDPGAVAGAEEPGFGRRRLRSRSCGTEPSRGFVLVR